LKRLRKIRAAVSNLENEKLDVDLLFWKNEYKEGRVKNPDGAIIFVSTLSVSAVGPTQPLFCGCLELFPQRTCPRVNISWSLLNMFFLL
jgi:hypothetical protein